MSLQIIIPTLLSFVASWYVFIPVLRMAKLKHMVDNPGERKLQQQPVPVMGGIAVYFGVIFGLMVGACLTDLTGVLPVMLAMTLLLLVGMLDDMLGVSPMKRMLLEMIAIATIIYGTGRCIDDFSGLWGIGEIDWGIAVPLTIFGCVGIINAINMIDGVNGLSSGLCITCSLLFGSLFLYGNDPANALLNFLMMAALIPFWIHNVLGRKSKMFIGDSGTMLMGILMSWDVIAVLNRATTTDLATFSAQGNCLIALVLAILSVPVFDTLRVMTMRILSGRSPFSPDRTHLHHIIYDYGKSHTLTALTEIAITLIITLGCVISTLTTLSCQAQLYLVILLGVVLVWGTYFILSYNQKSDTGFASNTRKAFTSMRQGNKRWWIKAQDWLDKDL